MVLGVKKDPSTDLSYASLAADKKAWNSKGLYTAKTDRFAHFGYSAITAFTNSNKSKKKAVDAIYDKNDGIADRVQKGRRNYAVMDSWTEKSVDTNALVNNDTRYLKATSPYTKPLGPGTYDGKPVQENATGSLKDPKRASSSFTVLPRKDPWTIKSLPDPSDTLTRDQAAWISKGASPARTSRFRPLLQINDQGQNNNLWNQGGLVGMSKTQRVPARDAEYDTNTLHLKTIDRNVEESPNGYSGVFRTKQDRLHPLPSVRSGDSRLRAPVGECDEWLGPGTYDISTSYIGNDNPVTSSAPGMFDSTFRGPPRFHQSGTQSPWHDSTLRKTW